MNKNQITIIILTIILLGTFLRIYKLDSQSLWLDEGYALNEVNVPDIKDVINPYLDKTTPEGTPPLYFILTHYWIKAFGNSEFSLRLPSVIFSSLAILVVYLLGSMLFSKKVGIASSIIMSVSMIHLVYAQEFRPYALLTLLSLLSIYFFAKLIKNIDNKNINQIAYFLLTLLMFYTHYLSFFVLFLEIIFVILFYKKMKLNLKPLAIILLLLTIFYIPGFYILSNQFTHTQESLQTSLSTKLGLPGFIADFGLYLFAVPIVIILLIVGIIINYWHQFEKFIKKIKFKDTAFFIILIIFFTFYAVYGIALTSSIFITRYTHFSYPILYILASAGFYKLRKSYKILIIMVFVTLAIGSLYSYYSQADRKEQWKEAILFLESNYNKEDLVVLVDADALYILNYYNKKDLHILPIKAILDKEERQSAYDNIKDKYQGYWLMLSHANAAQGFYNKKFNEDYKLIITKNFKGIDLYYYMVG